jgi:hypothetical protein
VINPDSVDSLLDGVEETNILSIDFTSDAGIPRVSELIESRGDGVNIVSSFTAKIAEKNEEGDG